MALEDDHPQAVLNPQARSVPELEELAGIKRTVKGLKGMIKWQAEDFKVEEVMPDGTIILARAENASESEWDSVKGSGEYLHISLTKKNWETSLALKQVANGLGVGISRLGFAGTKDRVAVTSQRISLWKPEPEIIERLKSFRAKDLWLAPIQYSKDRVYLGDLRGNKFTVTLRDAKATEKEALNAVEELKNGFPNFFGLQRFGSTRMNTHVVGLHILKGDFKAAVIEYISGGEDETRKLLRNLLDENDYQEAIKACPVKWRHELTLLHYLSEKYRDYPGALKKLSPAVKKLFVHAYQSKVFNELLSKRLAEKSDLNVELPLPGFDTPKQVSKELVEEVQKLLEKDGLTFESFRVKSLNELGSPGAMRKAWVVPEGVELLSVKKGAEGLDLTLSFCLEKSSYATIALKPFT